MSLRWNWNEQIGEIEWFNCDGTVYKTECYRGNAMLIDLKIRKDNSWELNFFIADKDHFKNLARDKEWDFTWYMKSVTFWDLNSETWSLVKELQRRGVPIKIYNGDIREKTMK